MAPSPPRKADRACAVQAARQFLENASVESAPVDPFAIARGLEIDVQAVPDGRVDFSGCLMREGRVWGILYRDDIPSEGFKRFTVAHELGHFEMTHHHSAIFATSELHASQSNFTSHLWHEIEADGFAAEVLLPERLFRDAIRATTIGLPAIKELSERFRTSLTSTAIRYASLSPDAVAIVVSEQGRVCYCFASPCMKQIRADFIERATPVPAASITHRMFREGAAPGAERQGTSYLSAWFDKATRDVEFSEDVIDLGRYGKTLTVLHASEVPSAEEPADEESDDDETDKFNRDGKRVRW